MTISLRLDDELARRVEAAAEERGLSKSEFIRQCLTEQLDQTERRPTAWEVGKDLFGCCHSGTGDLSTRTEEIVREKIHEKFAAKRRR